MIYFSNNPNLNRGKLLNWNAITEIAMNWSNNLTILSINSRSSHIRYCEILAILIKIKKKDEGFIFCNMLVLFEIVFYDFSYFSIPKDRPQTNLNIWKEYFTVSQKKRLIAFHRLPMEAEFLDKSTLHPDLRKKYIVNYFQALTMCVTAKGTVRNTKGIKNFFLSWKCWRFIWRKKTYTTEK